MAGRTTGIKSILIVGAHEPLCASPRFNGFTVDELVRTCDFCGRFYAKCPVHPSWTCHRNRVVFTDGACFNNGRLDAMAGIGIAFGEYTEDAWNDETHQFSLPVDDTLDPDGRRSSQRAELLAALEGLRMIYNAEEGGYGCERRDYAHRNARSRDWIIMTVGGVLVFT